MSSITWNAKPDVIAKSVSALSCAAGAVRAHAAQPHGTAQQRRGLAFVDVAQFHLRKVFVPSPSKSATARRRVVASRRLSRFPESNRGGDSAASLCLRGNLERLRQQRVRPPARRCFAKDLVVGRLAAAEIVVVHRRQVIVDERIGVDALERRRRAAGHRLPCRRQRRGGGEAERGAHPLAAGKARE